MYIDKARRNPLPPYRFIKMQDGKPPAGGKEKKTRRRLRLSCVECTKRRQVSRLVTFDDQERLTAKRLEMRSQISLCAVRLARGLASMSVGDGATRSPSSCAATRYSRFRAKPQSPACSHRLFGKGPRCTKQRDDETGTHCGHFIPIEQFLLHTWHII